MFSRCYFCFLMVLSLIFCEDNIFDLANGGDFRAVKQIIENENISPNTRDDSLNTVLHHAAKSGSLKLVKYLIKKGADINAINYFNETSLMNGAK